MNRLWLQFHGIERPDGPTVEDAVAALAELGLDPHLERWTTPTRAAGAHRKADAVALVRRRLCLTRDRDHELVDALGSLLEERDGLWSAGPADQALATIWFDR
jgi:hypothetical protein